MEIRYSDYWHVDNEVLICTLPPGYPSIIRKVSYPIKLLIESGDAIIRRTKFDTVKRLMAPIFAEIIISGIQANRGEEV